MSTRGSRITSRKAPTLVKVGVDEVSCTWHCNVALASPPWESNPELQACRQLSCLRPPPLRHGTCAATLTSESPVLLLTVPRSTLARNPALSGQEKMQANLKPTAAPGDGAPASEDPALIKKMRNQRTKPGRAMPVRTHYGCRAVP